MPAISSNPTKLRGIHPTYAIDIHRSYQSCHHEDRFPKILVKWPVNWRCFRDATLPRGPGFLLRVRRFQPLAKRYTPGWSPCRRDIHWPFLSNMDQNIPLQNVDVTRGSYTDSCLFNPQCRLLRPQPISQIVA